VLRACVLACCVRAYWLAAGCFIAGCCAADDLMPMLVSFMQLCFVVY
jgi:hypothetical protein